VSTPRRWLHVMSSTSAIGGHTALARRWIARDPGDHVHDVALTGQPAGDVAPALAAAAHASGGSVRSLADLRGLMERAAALRALAAAEADVVVLHTHMWDVLPAVAFGVAGGPPVLLMNHADHAFWIGASVADLVVDFRDSGAALTARLRAARAGALLPLPLEDGGAVPPDRQPAAAALGDASILTRDCVLLTVGRASKYQPYGDLDFPAAALRILDACGNGVLVAVGPSSGDVRFAALSAHARGRFLALGERMDLKPFHAAADLYLEGFPVGSYTALLEAALAGRAFVRKPLLASTRVLPVDGGALAGFAPPVDVDAYVAAAQALAADPQRRDALGSAAREAVRAMHCDGWPTHLAALHDRLPAHHDVGLRDEPPPMPPELACYVAGTLTEHMRHTPLDVAQEAALQQDLWPRPDIAVMDAMRGLARDTPVY
jgi:hypothetical protein